MSRSFLHRRPLVGLFAVLVLMSAGLSAQIPDPSPKPAPSPVSNVQEPAQSADAPAGAPAEAAETDTSGGLDAEQIYAVLVAEIAARRGDLETAFTAYMEAADLTKDPRLAELAVRAAINADKTAAIEQGLQRWLELDPKATGAHQLGAFARIKASDHEGALLHLMRLVEPLRR